MNLVSNVSHDLLQGARMRKGFGWTVSVSQICRPEGMF